MLFKLRPYKYAVYNLEIIYSGQIRYSILAVSKYFETLRKHAVHVRRKIDVTVPNDSHTIVHCNCDRDVLGNY
jgi:hypothetical protein